VVKKIAFIFPGQGAQYVGMGKDLYKNFPVAKELFDNSCEILDFDLKKLCFEGPSDLLSTTSNSQPAILATSIASLKVMQSVIPGLSAHCALGLSLGEYSALVAAGSLSFNDGLKLVHSRGTFMEEASKDNPGKMASILGLSAEEVEEICKTSNAEIANLNCPGQVVISGKNDAIEKAAVLAKEKGAKRTVMLDVSGPFHSSLMSSAATKLDRALSNVKFSLPTIPVISNINAAYETKEDEIKQNLVTQVSHRTYWEKSIKLVTTSGINTFVEIGPGKVLKGLLRKIDRNLIVHNVGTKNDIEELKNVIEG